MQIQNNQNINFKGAIKLPVKKDRELAKHLSSTLEKCSETLYSDNYVSFKFHNLFDENSTLEYLRKKAAVYIHYDDPNLTTEEFREFAK